MSLRHDHSSTASLEWVKSSYSAVNGNCVEIAALPDGNRAIRDSKNPTGPVLHFTSPQVAAFLSQLKA